METIAQCVNDRHLRGFGHVPQVLVGEGAPHNQRYHARQERPGVLVGFAFAHLGFAGFDHDGVTAELGDARRKAKSGACGGFVKEYRHGLRPFQWL